MELSEVLPQPGSVTVGGKEYKMHPITPGDIAKTQRFLTDQDLEQAMRATRTVPLSDDVRAKMIADIVSRRHDTSVVFTSTVGQLHLVWLSICKSGERPAKNYEAFEQSVDRLDVTTLSTHLMVLSGLLSPAALDAASGVGDDDPLAEDSTCTDEPRTFGGSDS